jgi:ribonuclease HI/ADP-ribose pyrophosphatase YjhB (NUDIX family)
MKQRIRVVALCKKEDSILLLKRAGSRVENATNYEFPIGKIEFGEQPDEAMSRVVYEHLDLQAKTLRLSDVITFTELADASQIGNLYIIYDVVLTNNSIDLKKSERYSAYKWVKLSEIGKYELDEASRMVFQITSTKTVRLSAPVISVEPGEHKKGEAVGFATIYTDGGSRGNPGPSGIGYYILGSDGHEIKRGGEFLGFTSSRLAEYYGLKEGLEQAIELGLKKVNFRSDNLMMVNQLNGVYPVKNKDLFQVHEDVLRLISKLDAFSIMHVPREQNRVADAEANRAMDEHARAA